VLSEFNYEKTYTDKMDYTMNLKGINVAVLSGVPGNDLHDAVMATSLTGYGLGATSPQEDLDKLYQNLVATRNAVAQNPGLVSSLDDPKALLKMLDYAIQYWYTDKRNEALEVLAKNEAQLNLRNGVNTINGVDLDPDDLALSGISIKKFFTSVKNTVKTVGQKVGDAAKVAIKAIVKFNPLTIAARAGFLLAMKINMGKMASKLKWAYATQQQAAAKGVNAATWQKSKNALAKIENLFADKLQGKRSALQNAILRGKAGNLNGFVEDDMLGQLGDPATGSVIAAATPVIIAAIKIIKESGLFAKNENVDVNNLKSEAMSDPTAAAAVAEIQANENAGANFDPQQNRSLITTSDSVSAVATTDPSTTPTSTGGGIMNFIKKNPVPAVIGGGLLAFGIYQLVKPKKATSLSGYGTRRRKPATTTRAKKPTSTRSTAANKTTVKSVKLF
jgi:hypothetical protein